MKTRAVVALLLAPLVFAACGKKELEEQNVQLQSAVEEADRAAAELQLAFDEVLDGLERMTADEVQIMQLLDDPEFGHPDQPNDLIIMRTRMAALDKKLIEMAEQREEIAKLREKVDSMSSDNAALSAERQRLLERVEKAENLLAQQTQTIAFLEGKVLEKEEEIAQLTADLEQVTTDFQTLTGEHEELSEEMAEVTGRFAAFKGDFGEGFVLTASKKELRGLRDQEILKRRLWVNYPGPSVQDGIGQTPGFKEVAVAETSIDLGGPYKEVKILSPHAKYPELYELGTDGESMTLEISNPTAFWALSRYLIIRVSAGG